MSEGPRIIRADRQQLCWDLVDLDSQLAEDHRARLVWSFVAGLDLSAFYARIKARAEVAGRPATDPAVLLALWLYASTEGVGAARELERLCQHHTAYRWLRGGVPINRDMLAAFRRESGTALDLLLTQSLTTLVDEGLLTLEEMAIDGTKVRARAGRGSLAKEKRLAAIEAAVAERIVVLKTELEADPAAPQRRRQERALQAAAAKAVRLARARQRLAALQAEQKKRAETHAKEEAEKGGPAVSVSDPEVRSMRLADGAVAPAWNVQVATAQGFVVTIEPTDRRNDTGLAPGLVEQIAGRGGGVPRRLLADTRAMTQADIVLLAEHHPDLTVYSPPPAERDNVTAETKRKRAWQRRHEAPALQDWRARMASADGKAVYRRRKLTERAHAQLKNHGMHRFLVHGRKAVHAVCLLYALAVNLLWAQTLRGAMAQPIAA